MLSNNYTLCQADTELASTGLVESSGGDLVSKCWVDTNVSNQPLLYLFVRAKVYKFLQLDKYPVLWGLEAIESFYRETMCFESRKHISKLVILPHTWLGPPLGLCGILLEWGDNSARFLKVNVIKLQGAPDISCPWSCILYRDFTRKDFSSFGSSMPQLSWVCVFSKPHLY